MLLRVAAAQSLLRSHHSAQRAQGSGGAMGRRSYGNGSNAADATLRQQLIQLLHAGGGAAQRGAGGGGGGGNGGTQGRGRGGGGTRGGGGAAAAADRQGRRPGDWTCQRCRYSNFAFRAVCKSCGAHADGGRSGQGAMRPKDDAPPQRGAAGGRAHFSAMDARTAASNAGEPSFHVPRGHGKPAAVSTGARPHMEAQPQRGAAASCNASGTAAPHHNARREDDATASNVARTNTATKGNPWAAAVVGGSGGAARARWSDDEPPCDTAFGCGDEGSEYADADAVWEEDDAEEDDNDLDDAWQRQPTSEDLRSRWMQEVRAVRALERVERDEPAPSSALLAARATRDRAEKDWRQSLEIRPVAIRMANVQRKADRAKRAVDKAAHDIDVFEEEMRCRRQALQEALDRAKDRYDGRLRQLDVLHREAGDLAAANAEGEYAARPAGGKAERLVNILTSEMQAIIELLDEGSEARGRANLILARVAAAEAEASAESEHQHFSIYTDAEDASAGEGYSTVAHRGRRGGARDTATATRRGPTWTPAANGRWNRFKPLDDDDDDMCIVEGTGDVGTRGAGCDEPRGQVSAVAAKGTAGKGMETQGQAGPSDGRETRQRKGGHPPSGDDGEVQQRPNKSHRGHDVATMPSVESAGDDAARALRLKQEQDAVIQATVAARASFGDEASMHIAGQLYAQKVEALKGRARATGIAPTVAGRELIQLSPEELNEWVEKTLMPAEGKEEEETKEL